MTKYKIRNVQESDSSTLRKLAHDCSPLDLHTPYTYWVITKLFSDTSFIMECENSDIGFITALYNGAMFFIWQIGILPKYQKKNLSHLLIGKVLDIAQEKGVPIYLSIADSNADSYNAFNNYCKLKNYSFNKIGNVELNDKIDLNFYEEEELYKIGV